MHVFLSADDSGHFLLGELQRAWPSAQHSIVGPRLVTTGAPVSAGAPPLLTFSRQWLPDAAAVEAQSISAWGDRLFDALIARGVGEQPWMLQVEPHYGEVLESAGQNRCRLVVENLREKLRRKRRQAMRSWRVDPEPFSPSHTLVQLLLTAPDRGWLSIAAAPLPHSFRGLISPFPKGEIPIASDKAAPSRAFAKLLEAERRLGRRIGPGETCVDLGASPGSWTYVALQRGARVIAVDRSPLRDDLMADPRLSFQQGDAFKYAPERPVDWLLCDVIAAPERSIELLEDWVRNRRARQFVVTIKFKGQEDYAILDTLKQAIPSLCSEFLLTRLCANKNEACAFGVVA